MRKPGLNTWTGLCRLVMDRRYSDFFDGPSDLGSEELGLDSVDLVSAGFVSLAFFSGVSPPDFFFAVDVDGLLPFFL